MYLKTVINSLSKKYHYHMIEYIKKMNHITLIDFNNQINCNIGL